MFNTSMNTVFQGIIKNISDAVSTAHQARSSQSDKKINNLIKKIELHSVSVAKEIADPTKRDVHKINESSKKLENYQASLKQIIQNSPSALSDYDNIFVSVHTSLSSIKIAHDTLSFEQEFKELFTKLEDNLGKLSVQSNWLQLGEEVMGFSASQYAVCLELVKKIHILCSNYQKEGYPETYQQYIDEKLKNTFQVVNTALSEHSSYIHEKIQSTLKNKKTEIDLHYKKLLLTSDENIFEAYREFVESVQKIQLLRTQFSSWSKKLGKSSQWIEKIYKEQGQETSKNFFSSVVSSISQTLFRPSTINEYATKLTKHLENDIHFYTHSLHEITDISLSLHPSITKANHHFIKTAASLDYATQFLAGYNDRNVAVDTEDEYIKLKKQLATLHFLFGKTPLTEISEPSEKAFLFSLKTIQKNLQKIASESEKTKGFHFSNTRQALKQIEVLQHQWEINLIKSDWSETTKRVVKTVCKSLQLYGRVYKPAKIYRANLIQKTDYSNTAGIALVRNISTQALQN